MPIGPLPRRRAAQHRKPQRGDWL